MSKVGLGGIELLTGESGSQGLRIRSDVLRSSLVARAMFNSKLSEVKI